MWITSRKPRAIPAPAADDAAQPPSDADAAPAREAQAEVIREIETAVRHYLAGYRSDGRGSLGRLARSGNLWREVSSLTLLQLVAFIEQRFAIVVRPIDFAPQNFASISAIARFVAAHRPSLPDR